MQDRYDRQRRIKFWDQEQLARSSVLLIGAGALGNEILKNLVLLGIGKIMVVDFDRIEASNLSRTVLFRPEDRNLPKAEIAARAAAQLNPEVQISFLDGNVFYDLGLGFYRQADMVISGLDNLAARAKVAQGAFLTARPFLDSGIWALGGELRCFLPGRSFCFDCTLSETDWQNAHLRRSCTGFRAEDEENEPAASNIATVSIIGGMVAQEVVKLLCDFEEKVLGSGSLESGDALVYNGLRLSLGASRLPGDAVCQCRMGKPIKQVEPLDKSVFDTTAEEVLSIAEAKIGAPATLELGRDLLLGFEKNCERQHCPFDEKNAGNPPRLMAKVDENEQVCTDCGRHRTSRSTSRVTRKNAFKNFTLHQLGIPPGEILTFWHLEQFCFLEMNADVQRFWA